jgi:hypothetical protein
MRRWRDEPVTAREGCSRDQEQQQRTDRVVDWARGVGLVTFSHRCNGALHMIGRGLQLFFLLCAVAFMPAAAVGELLPGSTHRLVFRDVDGDEHSTADGRVTIITVVTRNNEEKAREVANLVPEYAVGDPQYRYITIVNFQQKLARPLHGLTKAIIRRRLDAEARDLQERYAEKQLTRDARQDVLVVADFDGKALAQLGLPPDTEEIKVFVFNRQGRLIARWSDVPPPDALPKAITAAEQRRQ